MLDLKGIQKVITKLKKGETPGEVKYDTEGRSEIRVSYFLKNKMAFTFGLTRSSKAKSKNYYYIPRQMGISNREYKKLHDCPWDKADYNKKLIETEIV